MGGKDIVGEAKASGKKGELWEKMESCVQKSNGRVEIY